MTPLAEAYHKEFLRSDLAAAVEALQVTFGNICEDHGIDNMDYAGEVVTEHIWNAAKRGDTQQVMFSLGYLAAWADQHDVRSQSLTMRIKEVRNAIR